MTAPDPRVGEIEDRLEAAKYHAAPAFMIPTHDVSYLLAELRKAHEALARVSDWAGRNRTGFYDEAQDDVVQILRAALREPIEASCPWCAEVHRTDLTCAAVAAANGDGQ